MSRARLWAPFAIALIGGLAVTALCEPLGEAMGWYNPFTGYMAVGIYMGLPIGLVAAVISRTWRGVLTLCLGFLVAGAILGLVATPSVSLSTLIVLPLWTMLEQGVLAVPTDLVVTALIKGLTWNVD